MKVKNPYLFNNLGMCRYQITTTINDRQFDLNHTASSTYLELDMNITYDQLLVLLSTHFKIESGENSGTNPSSVQQYRNHVSTLTGFLASVGKTIDARIGTELSSRYDDSVKAYLALISVSERTRRDRRSHLNLCQRLFLSTKNVESASESGSGVSEFRKCIREAVARAGVAQKTLARKAGISQRTLSCWLRGASPNKRGIASLHRLEAHLQLPRGALASSCFKDRESEQNSRGTELQSIAYRERVKARRGRAIVLPESELSDSFKAEWRSLLEYKTATIPDFERESRATWRCLPPDVSMRTSPLATIGSMSCPTADMFLEKIRAFLATTERLPEVVNATGRGSFSQTLAWLTVVRAMSAYLDAGFDAAGGLHHRAHRTFCLTVRALLRPKTGYLWQRAELRFALPADFRLQTTADWQAQCEKAHKKLGDVAKKCNNTSRNPEEPISMLLREASPLAPVLHAIEAIERDAAKAPAGGRREATLRRDALLLAMLLANPLRVRTMVCLTWSPDNTGMLRGSSNHEYRIHLQAVHTKNGSRTGAKPYDVRVANWVLPRLVAYIEEYRATILGPSRSSPYLFVGSRNGVKTRKWEGMSSHVRKLTQRYIPSCPGFGPHAFRHLVATDWLKQHPNDFLTVAELLNDKLTTVLENYTHLKRDTSFLRYETHIHALTAGGTKPDDGEPV